VGEEEEDSAIFVAAFVSFRSSSSLYRDRVVVMVMWGWEGGGYLLLCRTRRVARICRVFFRLPSHTVASGPPLCPLCRRFVGFIHEPSERARTTPYNNNNTVSADDEKNPRHRNTYTGETTTTTIRALPCFYYAAVVLRTSC